ncbi:MAG: UTP--glucose-1-phosphate uridylyltransferase, partial [Bacteroidetes bacterium]|nr:UTP--glucose-1-phosphate uridylyltransferase [Bacteroidota bacterium]
METCKRTEADKKGGHLARDSRTGQLILRELAQAPMIDGQVVPEFSDIARYDQFNTNSIWLDLEHVVKMARL